MPATSNLIETINLKARVAQAEHRRMVDLQCLIPADNKVVLVLTAIMETAKTMLHNGLDDRRTASKLMSEIARRVYDMLPGRGVIDHEPQQD